MSNKRLNATITIGGAISGTLKSALGMTRDKVNEIGKAITNLKDRQRELNGVVSSQEKLGSAGSALKVQYAQQELGMINKQIDALRRKQALEQRIGDTQAAIASARSRYRTGMFEQGAAAIGVGGLMRAPLKAFEDLDAAMNNMEVAMTNSTGKLPLQFDAIKKQTIELGNLLPGTTADFVNLASALKEQGVATESIAGGALKSAAHLAVVMKMVPEQAGEMVAKLREAFQLSDDEFDKMADYTQRTRFGFGLKSEDLLLGAKYYGGKLNALGLTGADNVRRIYAIQGMAAQQGMDGSTFGTNFSMMLTRVGLMTERLHKNSKEMKAVNATLKEAGISMSFFDKKGKFAGVENMVNQLDKLKALSMEKRLQVLTRIFGEEGGRVADLIARNGKEGYQKALDALDAEASLAQRIAIATRSFKNQIEALGGTFTNFLAAVGEPLAELFTPVMNKLNEIIGGPMMTFIEQNKTLVKIVGGITAGSAGILALGAALNAAGFLATFAAGGFASVAAWGAKLVGMFGGMSVVIGGLLAFVRPLVLALAIAAPPVWALVAAGAALVGVGIAIWKFWEPIKAFFVGFGQGIAEGLAPIGQLFMDAFGPLWNVIGPMVMPVLEAIGSWVKSAWNWFTNLFTPIDALSETTRKFGDAGKVCGDVVAAAFRFILTPVEAVMEAIKWINGNIDGVIEKAGKVGEIMQKGVQGTKEFFGFGSKPQEGAQPAAPGRQGALPNPTMATSRTEASVTDNRQYNYTVNQSPGQDAKSVADEIQRRTKSEQGARRGGALYDHATGY